MYKRSLNGWIKHIDFTLLDIVAIQAAYVLAFLLRFRVLALPYQNDYYLSGAKVILVIHLILSAFTGEYSGVIRRTFWKETRYSFLHSTIVFIGLNVYLVAVKWTEAYSRIFLYLFWIIMFFALWFSRTVLKRIVRKRMLTSKNRSVLIVITKKQYAEEIVKRFKKDRYHDFALSGIVFEDCDGTGEFVMDIPVICSYDGFYEYARKNIVDEVFISDNNLERAEEYAEELKKMGITIHYRLLNNDSDNRMIENCGGFPVLTVGMNIKTGPMLMVKRIADIVGSIIGLIITGICFLIFAPIIFIQSPGPIFYKQTRIGKNGRRFKMYKFRSMYPNADEIKKALMANNEMDGNMFKLKNDPRIIPIGHFIRKHSIDELPQFWNVFKGDMSLVGTRPPTLDEFEKYAVHHKARLGFAPGLTGLWQVSGRNEINDFEQVVELDTKYIMEWSLLLDIRIILKTVKIVLTGRGAS
ncbi:MAG: sugar transferase [Lachnospiraceae bacterium]|nr:sugar transferase [Lachnospiraceae bacterium]